MATFNLGNKVKDDGNSTLNKTGNTSSEKDIESEIIEIIERPRICCIDLEKQVVTKLKESGANIFEGTLGSKIRVNNTDRYHPHKILLNYNFPSNLHEFDIFILDLQNYKTIDWKEAEHTRENITGNNSVYFLSSYPQTLFDPRPISSSVLKTDLAKIKRQILVIVFSTENYDVEYEIRSDSSNRNYYAEDKSFKEDIYSFWSYIPLSEKLSGKEISVAELKNDSLRNLLNKYKDEAIYHQTFYHPTNSVNNKNVLDENFLPLMKNLRGDIISFVELSDKGSLFVFPQIKDKANFLQDFLSDFAPTIFPEVFPFSATFKWKEDQNYWLPNHSDLLAKKDKIQQRFEKKLENVNSEIKENTSNLLFLHDLMTETDDSLVKSVIKFLNWLDFENVRFVDETKTKSSINEEDIQVDLPDGGLLVVECKGIGGTSTDSDCSQISKIKHRRCKQRNTFDVFALYIVNHQRYLPPSKRKNPPFTEHQIQDAINDERGLLTTWQLFNLYFDIENEIITKKEARELILNFGLVKFKPKNLQLIDKPTEIFKDGEVCIVNLCKGIDLTVNEILYVEKNNKFHLAKILEIKKDDENVSQATNGEFGLKLNNKIQKNSMFWKKVKE